MGRHIVNHTFVKRNETMKEQESRRKQSSDAEVSHQCRGLRQTCAVPSRQGEERGEVRWG